MAPVARYEIAIDSDARNHTDRIIRELHEHAKTTLNDVVQDSTAGSPQTAKIPGVVPDASLVGRPLPLPGDRCVYRFSSVPWLRLIYSGFKLGGT